MTAGNDWSTPITKHCANGRWIAGVVNLRSGLELAVDGVSEEEALRYLEMSKAWRDKDWLFGVPA